MAWRLSEPSARFSSIAAGKRYHSWLAFYLLFADSLHAFERVLEFHAVSCCIFVFALEFLLLSFALVWTHLTILLKLSRSISDDDTTTTAPG